MPYPQSSARSAYKVKGRALKRLTGALLIALCSLSALLSAREAEAHAWAKQKPVLFMSAEVSDSELKLTICLPGPLLNEVLSQPIDLNYPLSQELQRGALEELERYFQRQNPIKVDGVRALPNLIALDLVLSAPLAEVEAAPLIEQVKLHSGNEGAAIMTFEVGLKQRPKLISFLWDSEPLWARMGVRDPKKLTSKVMPGVIVYQDELTPIKMTPEDPEQLWRPLGPRQRPPSPSALSIVPPPPPQGLADHLGWVLLWLGALVICLRALLTQGPQGPRRTALISLMGLLCLSPVALLALPGAPKLWASSDERLSDEELKAIFEVLHQNIYRAFDYERDEEIYDALSESVTGPLLDWTFQEIYRSLILQDEGGAKAKVSLVKPLSWERAELMERERAALSADELSSSSDLEKHSAAEASAFAVRYRWRVIGEVTHWGHSHRRVNDYEARYAVAHSAKGWRIFSARSRGSARRPELEGGL